MTGNQTQTTWRGEPGVDQTEIPLDTRTQTNATAWPLHARTDERHGGPSNKPAQHSAEQDTSEPHEYHTPQYVPLLELWPMAKFHSQLWQFFKIDPYLGKHCP